MHIWSGNFLSVYSDLTYISLWVKVVSQKQTDFVFLQ
jgi:hypothetical protein